MSEYSRWAWRFGTMPNQPPSKEELERQEKERARQEKLRQAAEELEDLLYPYAKQIRVPGYETFYPPEDPELKGLYVNVLVTPKWFGFLGSNVDVYTARLLEDDKVEMAHLSLTLYGDELEYQGLKVTPREDELAVINRTSDMLASMY